MITDSHLKILVPRLSREKRDEWRAALNRHCPRYNINTRLRLAAFVANGLQETRAMTRLVEDMEYSAPRLMVVWPKRFPTLASAKPYAFNAEKLANFVYGNRMGNQTGKGFGYKYRGRGFKQTTGLDNYKEVETETGFPVREQPELLEQIDLAVQSACIFFANRNLGLLADERRFRELCIKVNGGLTGFAEREDYYKQCLGVFKNLKVDASQVAGLELAEAGATTTTTTEIVTAAAATTTIAAGSAETTHISAISQVREKIEAIAGGGVLDDPVKIINSKPVKYVFGLSSGLITMLVAMGNWIKDNPFVFCAAILGISLIAAALIYFFLTMERVKAESLSDPARINIR